MTKKNKVWSVDIDIVRKSDGGSITLVYVWREEPDGYEFANKYMVTRASFDRIFELIKNKSIVNINTSLSYIPTEVRSKFYGEESKFYGEE